MHVGWMVALLGSAASGGEPRVPAMDVGLGAVVRDASPAATLDLGLDAIQHGRFTLRVGVSVASPRALPELEEEGQWWRVTRSVWRAGASLDPRLRLAASLSVVGSVGLARLSFHQQGQPVSGSRLVPTLGAGVELGSYRLGVRPMVSMDLAQFELEQPDGSRSSWTPFGAGATLYVRFHWASAGKRPARPLRDLAVIGRRSRPVRAIHLDECGLSGPTGVLTATRFGRDPAKEPVITGDLRDRAADDPIDSREILDRDDPIPSLTTSEG